MASIFEQTIVPKIKFSNFNLSESQLITCNFGQLIPVYLREVLPNDVFTMSAIADVQFAPMIAPMMQDVHASIHFFYIPNRIVWDDFEVFITGAEEGHVLPENEIPSQPGFTCHELFEHIDGTDTLQGSILDYMGLPNNLMTENVETVISDFPVRDYFKIWYDYYRDENLQYQKGTYDLFKFWRKWRATSDPLSGTLASEFEAIFSDENDDVNLAPFYRAYRKDYFTAALPTPQKGEPVTLSLGINAPVSFTPDAVLRIGQAEATQVSDRLAFYGDNPTAADQGNILADTNSVGLTSLTMIGDISDNMFTGLRGQANIESGSMVADLRQASAITVEALREAFAVQEILESLSMRGSRYTEFLKGNFGVTPDDYKLQRPQFLGGIVTPVQVQQVLQNAGVDSDAGQLTGYAAGRAFAAAGDRVFRMRFKEHGYIMAIMSVMPKAYYYQGIPRHFLRRDRFDYYLPQTAHLGEQAIENHELYFDPTSQETNEAVFGYIPRWAEYKTATNGIHGDFRGSLNYYHMARVFGETPTLSEDFILTRNVQTRPFAVWQAQRPNVNHLIWANLYFKVVASRPMPYHSIPKVM